MGKRAFATLNDRGRHQKYDTGTAKRIVLPNLPTGLTDDSEVDDDDPFPDESVDAFNDDHDPDVTDNFHVTEIPDEFPDLLQQLLQSEQDQISMIDLEDQDSEEEVEDEAEEHTATVPGTGILPQKSLVPAQHWRCRPAIRWSGMDRPNHDG
jgi:hypothetical protein